MWYNVYFYQLITSIALIFVLIGALDVFSNRDTKIAKVMSGVLTVFLVLSCVGAISSPVTLFIEQKLFSDYVDSKLNSESVITEYKNKLSELSDSMDECFSRLPSDIDCKSNSRLLIESYNNYSIQSMQIKYVDDVYLIDFEEPVYIINEDMEEYVIDCVELKFKDVDDGVKVEFSPYIVSGPLLSHTIPKDYTVEVLFILNDI